jgi:hypothetical protein
MEQARSFKKGKIEHVMKKNTYGWTYLMVGILIGIIVAGLCLMLSAAWIGPYLKPYICK